MGQPHTLAQGFQTQTEQGRRCAIQTPGTPRSCPFPPGGGQSLPQEQTPCQGHMGRTLRHPRMAERSLPGPAPDAAHLFPVISFIHEGVTFGGKLLAIFLIFFLGVTFTVVQGQHPGGSSAGSPGKKKGTPRMTWPSPRNGADPKVLPQLLVTGLPG